MGLVNGTYVFQLMATDDKGVTGLKAVTLIVTVPSVFTVTLQQPSADTYLGYLQRMAAMSPTQIVRKPVLRPGLRVVRMHM
jgi:hypothetical protein